MQTLKGKPELEISANGIYCHNDEWICGYCDGRYVVKKICRLYDNIELDYDILVGRSHRCEQCLIDFKVYK